LADEEMSGAFQESFPGLEKVRQWAKGESMALTESTMLELGTIAPDFSLTDVVSGKTVKRDDLSGRKGLLVLFLSAHCPYVKHIEKSLGELGTHYADQPLAIVAIGSNDVAASPDDAPARLKAQAEANGFNFPYLFDETQKVARAYKAACTPDIYLFDEDLKLVYRGEYDSSRPGNGIPVSGEDLRFSIDLLLSDQKVPSDQRPSIGCDIKWKA
jgi:peroxiredoxin